MYTFALTLCAIIALLGVMALATEVILDRLVFDAIEEDETDAWYEAE